MPTDGSLADHLKEILTVHMVIFCALWQLQCDLIQIDFRSQTQILHIILSSYTFAVRAFLPNGKEI